MTDKKLTNMRLPSITLAQIEWLKQRFELTIVQVVIMAIDRMARDEGYNKPRK